jgi:spore germination cell wall hydrolase CwlJ-like protein
MQKINNSMAIITSLVISMCIVLASIAMSTTGTYAVPFIENHEDTFIPNRQVSYYSLTKHDRRQIDCLSENVYREAAGESKKGWVAVAFVTMNRLFSGNYADSVCGVVYQKNQFSWVGQKGLHKINEELYNEVRRVATAVYLGYDKARDVTNGATYYHADYVRPNWKNVEKVKQIGTHIFYRHKNDVINSEI